MTNRDSKLFSWVSAILFFLSALIWCYLFRHYLDGGSSLHSDSYPYYGHIRFYIENMMSGIYPFWDPLRENGNVNEFFLRRIGEFNPFFWLIAFLKKAGLSFIVAHRLFFAFYHFLGVGGFYLLTRRLFEDERVSFAAAIILLFSALGCKAFESFLLLEVVPLIWFAYFFISFLKAPRFLFFLGLTFCLMIINVTYIPFYFYTISIVFGVCAVLLYADQLKDPWMRIVRFFQFNKVCTLLCCGLWVVTFLPGYLWQQVSGKREAFAALRHTDSAGGNAAMVGIEKINQGGILPYLLFERQFVHLNALKIADFYLPLFVFIMVLIGLWLRLTRRMVLFFAGSFTLFLIGLADASVVHRFLYEHIFFFKYFRNLQFFLWIGLLPFFVLFVMDQMRIFLKECDEARISRKWMTVWGVILHAGAALFFLQIETTSLTVYAVIALSCLWMLGQVWGPRHRTLWLCILWMAIVVHPVEAFYRFATVYPVIPVSSVDYDFRSSSDIPSRDNAFELLQSSANDLQKSLLRNARPYFALSSFYEAWDHIDRRILADYLTKLFILYDHVEFMPQVDYKRVERSMAENANLAFVHLPPAALGDPDAAPRMRVVGEADKDFRILDFDSNSLSIETAFTSPKFFVRTSNYHSRWRVRIDDKPADLLRTNITAQGVWIPAGRHVVVWRFEDDWRYALAYWLNGVYIAVLGALVWLWRRSRKSSVV